MLDVMYYLLEEDTIPATPELAKARSHFRTNFYRDFLDRTYRFAIKDTGSSAGGHSTSDEIGGTGTSVVPQDGRTSAKSQSMTHKPYIPPTDTDIGPNPRKPFSGLDAPLG
jgi:hypothetical protein